MRVEIALEFSYGVYDGATEVCEARPFLRGLAAPVSKRFYFDSECNSSFVFT